MMGGGRWGCCWRRRAGTRVASRGRGLGRETTLSPSPLPPLYTRELAEARLGQSPTSIFSSCPSWLALEMATARVCQPRAESAPASELARGPSSPGSSATTARLPSEQPMHLPPVRPDSGDSSRREGSWTGVSVRREVCSWCEPAGGGSRAAPPFFFDGLALGLLSPLLHQFPTHKAGRPASTSPAAAPPHQPAGTSRERPACQPSAP